jgi:hypothetical protein
MNSELGMVLPFVAVLFTIWCGTRIVLRWIDRRESPVDAERRLRELSDRLDRVERMISGSAPVVNARLLADDPQLNSGALDRR